MRSVQVRLRHDQLEGLKSLARGRGVSLAELVREGVDSLLREPPLGRDPLWDIIGIADAGPSDLAENHDKYLAEAYADLHEPCPEKSS